MDNLYPNSSITVDNITYVGQEATEIYTQDLFNIDKFLVLGNKGTGKTYIYRSLANQHIVEELRKRATNQQVTDEILSPSRGTIYDSKGEALAQSIAVDTISLNPGYVKYYDGDKVENEVIAEGVSGILELDYNKVLEFL